MEMNVRDQQKFVEIWLTNAEKIDPVLREGLKEIYARYQTKNIWSPCSSPARAIFTRICGTCCSSTAAAAPKRPCSRRKSSVLRAWSGKPQAEGSFSLPPVFFLPKFNP